MGYLQNGSQGIEIALVIVFMDFFDQSVFELLVDVSSAM
jgi:hypothetical protein